MVEKMPLLPLVLFFCFFFFACACVFLFFFFPFGKKYFICILPVSTCLAVFLKYDFKSQRYILFREACFSKLKVRL